MPQPTIVLTEEFVLEFRQLINAVWLLLLSELVLSET